MFNQSSGVSISQVCKKLEAIVLAAIFFSIPFLSIVTNILIVLWILVSLPNFKRDYFNTLLHRKDMLLYTVMYLLLLLGLAYTIDFETGVSKIQTQLSFLVFPLLLGGQHLSEERRRVCIRYFVFGLAIAIGLCLGNALYRAVSNGTFYILDEFSNKHNIFLYREFSAFLDLHPTYFSLYLGTGLFCLMNFRSLRIGLNSWANIILIVFFFAALFLTSSKAGIFSFITIALVFYIYKSIKKRRKLYMGILVLMFAGTIAMFVINPILYNRSMQSLASFDKALFENKPRNESTSIRYYLWKLSLETGRESLVLGHGTGSVKKILNGKCLNLYAFSTCETLRNKNSHNQYLNFLVSNGIIFAFIFFLALAIGMVRALQVRDVLLILFILFMSLNFLFESLLQRERGIVFFMLFITMFVASGQKAVKKAV